MVLTRCKTDSVLFSSFSSEEKKPFSSQKKADIKILSDENEVLDFFEGGAIPILSSSLFLSSF